MLGLPLFAAEAEEKLSVSKDIPYIEEHHPQQTLDIYWSQGDAPMPVVIYVHGGGWAFGDKAEVHAKPGFFMAHNMALVSVNYRLRWDYNIYDQLEDIASAIHWVRKNSSSYNIDKSKIVLMGHAAGAHLASLLATDQRVLKVHSVPVTAIRLVAAIDTASYDIDRLMSIGNFIEQRQHRLIFGDEEKVWRQASPITHVQANKSIPSFALLYVADSELSSSQAVRFSRQLSKYDVQTILIPGNQKDARSIDVELGTPGDIPTLALMAFIRATL